MFIYWLFKQLFRLAIWIFYRRIHVKGRDKLEESGPLIVVANHPNGMLDPVLVASLYRRDFFFLAMSKLFKGRLRSWLLHRLRIVPVYRPSDGQDARQNLGMFDDVARKLGEGGAIIVFPEGTSEGERRLFPMKTGPARIAFLAESMFKWGLKLKVQPVGSTYSDFGAFRGTVTLAVGDVIDVSEFQGLYEKSPRAAVAALTRRIQEKLQELTVSVKNIEHDRLVDKIEKVYNLNDPDVHARLGQIVSAVDTVATRDPEIRADVEERIDDYLESAESLKLIPGQEVTRMRWWLLYALIAPFVAIGGVLHWLPIHVTMRIANLPHHKSYTATRKLLIGTLSIVLWYVLMFCALLLSVGLLWTAALLAFSAGCGVLANTCLPWVRMLYYRLPIFGHSKRMRSLKEQRQELIDELEALRNRTSA